MVGAAQNLFLNTVLKRFKTVSKPERQEFTGLGLTAPSFSDVDYITMLSCRLHVILVGIGPVETWHDGQATSYWICALHVFVHLLQHDEVHGGHEAHMQRCEESARRKRTSNYGELHLRRRRKNLLCSKVRTA